MTEARTITPAVLPAPEFFAPASEDGEARFRAFYRDHHRSVWALFVRMGLQGEGEDLVQEVFLKAWRGRSRFRAEASPKTWLLRIATNLALDRLRARRPADLALDESIAQTGGERPFEARDAIRKALSVLSPDMLVVIVLHVYEEHTTKEISEILGVAEGTVKSRMHRAKLSLQEELKRLGVEP